MVSKTQGEMMTNPYFNYTNPVAPGAPILSNKYNGDFKALERAFSTLPDPNDLIASYKNFGITTGSTTAYSLQLDDFDSSFGYTLGMQVVIKMHVSNTGPATISVNGLPSVPMLNLLGGNGPLESNDLRSGVIYSLRYDGSSFQLANPSTNYVARVRASAVTAKNASDNASSLATSVNSAYANLLNGPLAVGAVKFYDVSVNPNTLYPGTTWVQLSGTSPSVKGWSRTA